MTNRHHTALSISKLKTAEDAEHMKLDLIMFDDEECFDNNKEGIREFLMIIILLVEPAAHC